MSELGAYDITGITYRQALQIELGMIMRIKHLGSMYVPGWTYGKEMLRACAEILAISKGYVPHSNPRDKRTGERNEDKG